MVVAAVGCTRRRDHRRVRRAMLAAACRRDDDDPRDRVGLSPERISEELVLPEVSERGMGTDDGRSTRTSARVTPIELRPFTPDLLGAVAPWFDDAETVRWLGGRDWPENLLRLIADP